MNAKTRTGAGGVKRLNRGLLLLLLLLALAGCRDSAPHIPLDQVPQWSGQPYVEVEGNVPGFTQQDRQDIQGEYYAPLDWQGRCVQAVARVGWETMPTGERGSIGQVKPTGWHLVKYDCVDGKYLYNRCHLIGFQLTGENANEENLITGTRYLNVEGMLPFENLVAEYVQRTGNHVLYRATPIFEGEELLARGVQLEGWSVEDEGAGVCFNVYAYNVQPGVVIDYATGDSHLEGDLPAGEASGPEEGEVTYILNKNSKKFHLPDCAGAASIKPQNREQTRESRQQLLERGYEPCGQCRP